MGKISSANSLMIPFCPLFKCATVVINFYLD
jgi:hypothetical protein